MTNVAWLQQYRHACIQHLTYPHSNHFSLLIKKEIEVTVKRVNTFIFEAWWTLEETLERAVKDIWEQSTIKVLEKLGILQKGLQIWVKDIWKDRKGWMENLQRKLEQLLEDDINDETLAVIIDIKFQLNWKIKKNEVYWEQRTRANWLALGDRSTTFSIIFPLSEEGLI